eukprot:g19804.t1
MATIERLESLPRVQFGRTDMMVSRACGGTMMWGTLNKEERMAHEQLDALVEQGVNFIDTAELYPVPFEGGKVTEEWIGHWLEGALAAKKIQRDQFYIATKANPSNNGLIKHWALSNENNYGVTMLCLTCDRLNVPRPVCVQNDYSLNNRIFDTDCYEACHRFGLVSCHFGLLCGGVLSGKYIRDSPYAKKDMDLNGMSVGPLAARNLAAGGEDPGRDLGECRHHARPNFQPRYSYPMPAKATERYVVLAEKYGLTPTELAVAWANQRPHAGAVIIGTTTKRQVEECVGACKIKARAVRRFPRPSMFPRALGEDVTSRDACAFLVEPGRKERR